MTRLSIQIQNIHEPRQCCLSRFDGQVRSRAESDLPDSRESAGRCTPDVLHAHVLCVGSRDMATDTHSTRARHSKSTRCPDAEDHDACETLVDHAEGFETRLSSWELYVGEWERASGTALADAVKYTVMNMAPIFS